ncbi:MAG: hypothetical protein MZU95_15695 [Desulfomicrobium escambiense]|nr:hypothetical protein [Desulfomicrobium escambiense]
MFVSFGAGGADLRGGSEQDDGSAESSIQPFRMAGKLCPRSLSAGCLPGSSVPGCWTPRWKLDLSRYAAPSYCRGREVRGSGGHPGGHGGSSRRTSTPGGPTSTSWDSSPWCWRARSSRSQRRCSFPFTIAVLPLVRPGAAGRRSLERIRVPRILGILLSILFIRAGLYLVGIILFSSGRTILTLYPKYERRFSEIYSRVAELFSLPYDEHLTFFQNLWGQLGLRVRVQSLAFQLVRILPSGS